MDVRVVFDKERYAAKFEALAISGLDNVAAELQSARDYVAALPALQPAGFKAATRTLDDVQRIARNVRVPCQLFSGSLTQLCLDAPALSRPDYGGIAYIIENATDDARSAALTSGPIVVNIDDDTVGVTGFKRANKMPKLMHCVC